jgi:hypothetical protein
MTTFEQVAQLKQQAVELLLSERERIDAELAILQVEKTPAQKRRGRPLKVIESDQLSRTYSSESAPL